MSKQLREKAVSIPSSITRGESLVVIPQKAYKEFLNWRQKVEWEKKDTDNAIEVFKKERTQGKLKRLKSLKKLR